MTKTVRLASVMVFALCSVALAWWGSGHVVLTEAAVKRAAPKLPSWFQKGMRTIVSGSMDPDIWRNHRTPQLKSAQSPDHYLDLELLKGHDLPATRAGYVSMCERMGTDPDKAGYAPYAVLEWMQRLALGFAHTRKCPEDSSLHAKCLVFAGILSHYAQDMCQPLHLTIHYDGRVDKNGNKVSGSGIHAKMDGLIEHLGIKPEQLIGTQPPSHFDAPVDAVFAQLRAIHTLVDSVYALDKELPSTNCTDCSDAVESFGLERARSAVEFTAALYLSAWELSKKIELPGWLKKQ